MTVLDMYKRILCTSLRVDLTSKSIGNPKAYKAKQDPVDQREETHNTDKYWIILQFLAYEYTCVYDLVMIF